MNRESVRTPPRLAAGIVSLCAGRRERPFVLGDLAEEYADRVASHGRPSASRWYWEQAVRSSASFLLARTTSPAGERLLRATLAGVLAAILSSLLVGALLCRLLGPPGGYSLGAIAAVVACVALASSFCAGAASTLAAGRHELWILVPAGLVLVVPEALHTARIAAPSQPIELLPLVFVVVATSAGLLLGQGLSAHFRTGDAS